MKHVLFIEDDKLFRDWIAETLQGEVTLESVGTLAEGLARLSNGAFDCALLDLNLPDSQGEGTYQRLRSTFPNLPIVILSGALDEGRTKRLYAQGAVCCLCKWTHAKSYDLLRTTLLRAFKKAPTWTKLHMAMTECRTLCAA